MTIEDAALKLKSWAASKGILTHEPPDDLDAYLVEDLGDVVDVPNAATAEGVLRHRRINFIGVNHTDESIVVFTHLKTTKSEIDALPSRTEEGYQISYIKGHAPAVKSPKPGPTFFGPCDLHNNRYTCGSSVFSGNKIGAGTLGALVRDAQGVMYGLTNNHVTGGCSYSEPGLPVVAPGPMDISAQNRDPFTIGHHHSVLQLRTGTPDNVDVSQNLDAALFKIANEDLVSSMQRRHFDTPNQTVQAQDGMSVQKVGRTTNLTGGTIIAHSVGTEQVEYAVPEYNFRSNVYFTNIFVVQSLASPFGDRGDSGSLVVTLLPNGERAAIGIVFAVSPDRQLCFVAPIDSVLGAFNVTLVSNHNV